MTEALPVLADYDEMPATYRQARNALATCARLDECKDWGDKAAAMAVYARQAGDDELEKMAQRIKLRAFRRYGELREAIEPQHGANQNIGSNAGTKVYTRAEADAAAGMSKAQASRAGAIARVPDAEFEDMTESETPPSIDQMARHGRSPSTRSVKAEPIVPPAALWFWGWLREYEREAGLDEDAESLCAGVTSSMRDEIGRLAPRIASLLSSLRRTE